jgi:hypothetical protein
MFCISPAAVLIFVRFLKIHFDIADSMKAEWQVGSLMVNNSEDLDKLVCWVATGVHFQVAMVARFLLGWAS